MSKCLLFRCLLRVCRPVVFLSLAGMFVCDAGVWADSVDADRVDDDFNTGVVFWRKHRWSLAADSFEQFLKDHPDHELAPLATLYLGLSYSSLQEHEAAREQFENYLRLEPESSGSNAATARYRIGESSFYLRDYKAAAAQLEDYVRRHPKHTLIDWGRLQLGESWIELGEWEKGEAQLHDLETTDIDERITLQAQYALARSLEHQGRLDEAVESYRRLSLSRSQRIASRALARAGTVQFRQEKYQEAASLYDEITGRFPDSELAASALLNAGLAYYRDKQYENALDRFDRIPRGTTESTEAALLTGKSLSRLGRTEPAREVLKAAFAIAAGREDKARLAAEILFEQAGLERLDGHHDLAAQMFIDLADRWPDDGYAADALYNAASLKLEANDSESASRLLSRLESDFPDAFSKPGIRVLEARILAGRNQHEAARPILQTVAEDRSADERSKAVALYYLARMEHDEQKFDSALTTVERLQPLLESGSNADLQGALAVGALSAVEVGKLEVAEQLATRYLADPSGSLVADALAARAVARARQAKYDSALDDVTALISNSPKHPQTWTAVLNSAEHAWEQNEYATAFRFFDLTRHQDSPASVRESGSSGAAWCYYQQKKFDDAAEAFGKAASDFPSAEVGMEAAFMKARSLHDAGRKNAAVSEYVRVSKEFAQRAAAETDNKRLDQLQNYALESGQLAARLLGESGNDKLAEKQWADLADRFTKLPQLDEILDEWAWVNLKQQRYADADRIYRRLIKECPESTLVATARLSLAESDLSSDRLDSAVTEFEQIADHPNYGEAEKEKAIHHLVDIRTEQQKWDDVVALAGRFAKDHSGSDLAPRVQLFHADALMNLNRLEESRRILNLLRNGVVDGHLDQEAWTERIWVLLGEVALSERRFSDIDAMASEYEERFPEPQSLYQIRYVQGRRWKNQPEPEFDRARELFEKAVYDSVGRGTHTAARCQFLIGETHLMQEDYRKAAHEYYKVYTLYEYPDLQARALFQAAGCQSALGDDDEAAASYRSLVQEFPKSEFAAKARQQLGE